MEKVKEFSITHFERLGYYQVRQIDDGTWVGLIDFPPTTSLCIGLDTFGWESRYYFDVRFTAFAELLKLHQRTDVPTNWIAKRP